jgi:multiple sugar transport system permease protein
LFLLPWLVGFLALTVWPFAATFSWSFTRYDLLTSPEWVGSENYARLGQELVAGEEFGQALGNTAYYAAVSIPGSVLLGIALAVMLNRSVRGVGVWRTLLFLPSMVPAVAASMIWLLLLDPHSGLVNRLLAGAGWTPAWFNSPALLFTSGTAGALDGLVVMTLWGVGNTMVIFLAGLQDVPREIYEAAELDGAGPARQFWSITLPLLTPVIFFNVVMGLVNAVQYFTQAYVVSGGTGAPQGATRLLALHVFLWGFKYLDAGYASAAAWLMFVFVAALTLALFRSSRHWVHTPG